MVSQSKVHQAFTPKTAKLLTSLLQSVYTFLQVKSYLTGNPAIAIALNDSLVIGRREGAASAYGGYGRGADAVMLDDCNFHQSVTLDRFETERTLQLVPPDGEFAVMNYRSTYPFKPPFRVVTTVEEDPNSGLKV